ncbi:MAG TPA: hypothetical protein VF745_14590 [Steroidobacteraceae bacterium]
MRGGVDGLTAFLSFIPAWLLILGLARALATNPEILLMDEPFSALDPLIRRKLQDELLALQERLRKTILFVSHDLDEALRLGDRISILEGGRIVQTGSRTSPCISTTSRPTCPGGSSMSTRSISSASRFSKDRKARSSRCSRSPAESANSHASAGAGAELPLSLQAASVGHSRPQLNRA